MIRSISQAKGQSIFYAVPGNRRGLYLVYPPEIRFPYAPAVRKYAVSAKNADTAFFVPQDLYEFVFNFSWFRLAVANASYIGSKKSCEVLI